MNEKSDESTFWRLICKETEVIRLKAEIQRLEGVVQSTKDNFFEEQVGFEKQIENLKQELENEKERHLLSKKEIAAKIEKINSAGRELDETRSDFLVEKGLYEKRILELQKYNKALKSSNNEIVNKIESLKVEHRRELIDRDNLIVSLRSDVENLEKEKEIYLRQIETIASNLKDVQELESQLNAVLEENRRLSDEINDYGEAKRLGDIFQEELRELSFYRRNNEELREKNQNLFNSMMDQRTLQEKIEVMEHEIEVLKKENEKIPGIQNEYAVMIDEMKEWQTATGFQNPTLAAEYLSALKERENYSTAEVNLLKTRLEELTTQNAELSLKCTSLEKEFKVSGDKLSEFDQQLKRLNKKCLLLNKERDGYKKIIDAYENETTMSSSDAATRQRITDLESTLSEYRSLVARLETESQEKFDKNEATSEEPKRKRTRTDDGTSESENTEHDLLQNRLKEQEALCKNVIEENKLLKNRLEELQNVQSVDSSNKAAECTTNMENEVDKLKQELIMAERRKQHILEAFKKTSKEFREVVYILTGYRIDALKQKVYRLSHVYAECQNDVLLFELESGGTMKLLHTEYSDRISTLVDLYLNKHHSFPAFFAALTMDLFQLQTHIAIDSSVVNK